jgi:drug/metabolite transporter (DMT)-like permease
MAALLALLAALGYGASDFGAGVASRRFAAAPVATATQLVGLSTTAIAIAFYGGTGPTVHALGWGALAGLGSGFGTFSLYQGLAVGRMSVVATVSAVLAAVLPAAVSLGLGQHLTTTTAIGIGIAIPAIGLVAFQAPSTDHARSGASLRYGLQSGLGFALLFIALDRAGTHAGAWPVLPAQVISVLLIAPFALGDLRSTGRPPAEVVWLALGAGVLGGTANLLFLAATGRGTLAVASVLTSLYPAVTILLARAILHERWSRWQAVGLLTAAAAIVLVSIG